jgi:hypothetical protein
MNTSSGAGGAAQLVFPPVSTHLAPSPNCRAHCLLLVQPQVLGSRETPQKLRPWSVAKQAQGVSPIGPVLPKRGCCRRRYPARSCRRPGCQPGDRPSCRRYGAGTDPSSTPLRFGTASRYRGSPGRWHAARPDRGQYPPRPTRHRRRAVRCRPSEGATQPIKGNNIHAEAPKR